MRERLHPSCVAAKSGLSRQDYWSLLSHIVDDLRLPNRFVCTGCDRLHTTNLLDAPYNSSHMLCHTDFTAVGHSTSYSLRQRHVQLALRYFRSDLEHDYLSRLLAPYSVFGMTSNQDLIQKFSAQARIIDERFILPSSWKFLLSSKSFSRFSISQLRVLQLCPHLSHLRDANPALPTNHLTRVMRYAEQNIGTQTRSSCPRCATVTASILTRRGFSYMFIKILGPAGALPILFGTRMCSLKKLTSFRVQEFSTKRVVFALNIRSGSGRHI
jgi:hypothetical protein